MNKSLRIQGKEINIQFILDDKPDTSAVLEIGETYNSPNEIVIALIHELKKDKINLKYYSSSPYWIFHDISHALYTPELFVPNIIEIPFSKEKLMYMKGVELARKAKLSEEYLKSVPEIQDVL